MLLYIKYICKARYRKPLCSSLSLSEYQKLAKVRLCPCRYLPLRRIHLNLPCTKTNKQKKSLEEELPIYWPHVQLQFELAPTFLKGNFLCISSCVGFTRQGFSSWQAAGMASLRRCQQLPSTSETVPEGTHYWPKLNSPRPLVASLW